MRFRVYLILSCSTDANTWVCYGSESMAIPFINFTDETSERASDIALYVHFLLLLITAL
jgi:hypothetical protein